MKLVESKEMELKDLSLKRALKENELIEAQKKTSEVIARDQDEERKHA